MDERERKKGTVKEWVRRKEGGECGRGRQRREREAEDWRIILRYIYLHKHADSMVFSHNGNILSVEEKKTNIIGTFCNMFLNTIDSGRFVGKISDEGRGPDCATNKPDYSQVTYCLFGLISSHIKCICNTRWFLRYLSSSNKILRLYYLWELSSCLND